MALASGVRLGPYETAAQIGVGGMGEVYRATDTLPVQNWEGDRKPPEHYPTNNPRKRLAKRLDETSPSERS